MTKLKFKQRKHKGDSGEKRMAACEYFGEPPPEVEMTQPIVADITVKREYKDIKKDLDFLYANASRFAVIKPVKG